MIDIESNKTIKEEPVSSLDKTENKEEEKVVSKPDVQLNEEEKVVSKSGLELHKISGGRPLCFFTENIYQLKGSTVLTDEYIKLINKTKARCSTCYFGLGDKREVGNLNETKIICPTCSFLLDNKGKASDYVYYPSREDDGIFDYCFYYQNYQVRQIGFKKIYVNEQFVKDITISKESLEWVVDTQRPRASFTLLLTDEKMKEVFVIQKDLDVKKLPLEMGRLFKFKSYDENDGARIAFGIGEELYVKPRYSKGELGAFKKNKGKESDNGTFLKGIYKLDDLKKAQFFI